MKRREFMTLLGGAAAWPIVARAQRPGAHNIGFLSSLSEAPSAGLVAAFRRGLQEAGFVEGDNVTVEYRWADGRYDRLAAMAAELVARRVDVLVSTGGGPTATAAKEASSTIPVVFITGTDPVRSGLVSNFSHPAGNLTGVYILTTETRTEAARPAARAGPAVSRSRGADEPEQYRVRDTTRGRPRGGARAFAAGANFHCCQ